jgi:large subunit ribosomal protein L25
MLNQMIELTAEHRNLGTGPSRAIRRDGKITACLYGDKKEQLFFSLPQKDMTAYYRKGYFTSTIFLLKLDGKSIKILPHAVDLDPITELVTNVDFLYVKSDIQEVKIPILFDGKDKALGVKRGGFFNITRRKIKISCSQGNIPQFIPVDVTNMKAGLSLRVKDIVMPEGCTLLEDSNLVVASILGKVAKEETEVTTPATKAK